MTTPAARADPARHLNRPAHAARTNRPGRGREVRAAVLAAGERVAAEVERARHVTGDGRDQGGEEEASTVRT